MPQFMPQLRLILVYSGLSTFTKVLVRLDEIDSGLFWFTYRHSFKSCHLDFLFPCESREFRRFWNVYATIMPQRGLKTFSKCCQSESKKDCILAALSLCMEAVTCAYRSNVKAAE